MVCIKIITMITSIIFFMLIKWKILYYFSFNSFKSLFNEIFELKIEKEDYNYDDQDDDNGYIIGFLLNFDSEL